MAITGDALLITLRYVFLGQNCQTAQFYTPGGAAFITANCDAVGEAWWNDVKTDWRALVPSDVTNFSFESVLVEEFDGSGGLGEFAIPSGERDGTRIPSSSSGFMPSYVACGMRLTVPTRTTRPGQKRFPGLDEADVSNNVIGAEYLDLVEDLSRVYDTTITLGAPVALGTLTPKICKRDPADGHILASQDVAGHVINPYVTSQVSRRRGHGS